MSNWLIKLIKFTTTTSGNYQAGSTIYNEIWVKTNSCPNGGSPYNPCSTATNILTISPNSGTWVNIYHTWNGKKAEKRYANTGNANGHYSTVKDAAKDIVDKIKNLIEHFDDAKTFYDTSNTNGKVSQEIEALNEKYKAVTANTLDTLNKVSIIINRL